MECDLDLLRKKKEFGTKEPMPKEQLQRILQAFRRHGGFVKIDKQSEDHLRGAGAEGATLDAKTMLFIHHPSRATVFEELIHATQYANGAMENTYASYLQCEIAAQKKLLDYSDAYRLTSAETEETKVNLAGYQERLEEERARQEEEVVKRGKDHKPHGNGR